MLTQTGPTRRVLIVSPHFPPDNAAGAHRARVIAPYLRDRGWIPTVLTVEPSAHEGALDDELGRTVEGRVDVIRVPAWRAASTRRFGLGDLGLRAFLPLYRAASAMSADAIYLTTYPFYPAAFGPRLKRALGAPLVVDLQDPWVGEWGRSVGGGPGGVPDLKSRATRSIAARIERFVLPRADALTSVSSGLLDELAGRYPALASIPRLTLPIGIDPRDIEWVRLHDRQVAAAPPADGHLHLCYAGTLLPLGHEALDAILAAVARVSASPNGSGSPRNVRLHFVGTSHQASEGGPLRVVPRAAAHGVAALVHETPARVPYLDALRILSRASAVLVMGTTESRYTASKLQPALSSGRPVLAVVHDRSDVAKVLRPLARRDAGIALLTYDDDRRAAMLVEAIAELLGRWLQCLPARLEDTWFSPGHRGPELAEALAALLDRLTAQEVRSEKREVRREK